jgi:hypothetical protein
VPYGAFHTIVSRSWPTSWGCTFPTHSTTPKSVVKIPGCECFVVFFIPWEILKFCALKFLRESGSLFKMLLKLLVQKCLRLIIQTRRYSSPDFGLADPQKFLFRLGKHTFIFIHCCNKCLLTHILICREKTTLDYPDIDCWPSLPLEEGQGGHAIDVWWLLLWLMVSCACLSHLQ